MLNKKLKPINLYQFFILLIISFYLITGYTKERYNFFYPTLNLYPNNKDESKITQDYTNKRSIEMLEFIKLTDPSVIYAFLPYISENYNELFKIEQEITIYILFFKYLFNRARPKQVNLNIKLFKSKTSHTPAFPSGHSMQAFYLAKKLSIKYPEKKQLFFKIAEKCGQARIYGGLHYPSDHNFGKYLINLLP